MDILRLTYLVITLLCCLLYLTKINRKLLLANQYLAAIIAVILLINVLLELFVAWHTGYLELVVRNRLFMTIHDSSKIVFGFLMILLGILNFFRKNRDSKRLQLLLVSSYVLFFMVPFVFSILLGPRIIPGVHSTVFSSFNPTFIFCVLFLIGMLINFLITYFKWLPELKGPKKYDPTFDALID